MGSVAHQAASSDNPARLLEGETRAAREQLAWVAATQVADEVGAYRGAGPERGIDLGRIEAAHRPAIEAQRTRGNEEVAALQAAVAKGGRFDDVGLAGEPAARAEVVREQLRQLVVERHVHA